MASTPRLDKLERNLLINGGFSIWQRAGSVSPVNTTTGYTYAGADRWLVKHTGTFTGTPNIVRDTVIPDAKFPNSLKHTFQRNASAATFNYQQRIESFLASSLSVVGTASLTFYVNPSVAGNIVVTIYNPTVIDTHASQTNMYTSSSIAVTAGSWQKITLESIAITANASLGLAVDIQYQTASGTDGSAQTFRLTRAMLTEADHGSDFQRHGGSHISDFIACQRYFESSGATTAWFHGDVSNTGTYGVNVNFAVVKRATPTLVTGAFDTIVSHRGSSFDTSTPAQTSVTSVGFLIRKSCIATSGDRGWDVPWTAEAEL